MIYCASFYYPGPYCGVSCEGEAENKRLHSAEEYVEEQLRNHDIKFRHAYSWPDGSLYKYIQSDLELSALREQLLKFLGVGEVRLCQLDVTDPQEKPWKYNRRTRQEYATLEEYMNDVVEA